MSSETEHHTSWKTVHRAVKSIVLYSLEHRKVSGVTALGIDEVQHGSGQKYMTLIYQIDAGCHRLLWVVRKEQKKH